MRIVVTTAALEGNGTAGAEPLVGRLALPKFGRAPFLPNDARFPTYQAVDSPNQPCPFLVQSTVLWCGHFCGNTYTTVVDCLSFLYLDSCLSVLA